MLSAPIVLVAIAMLAAGAVTLAWGLRGRIQPGIFECRRCRYPAAANEPTGRCPECGADLAAAGAVRPTRRRRVGAIRAGAALLAVAIGVVAYLVTTRSTPFNLYASLPSSILGWMVRSADAETMDRAATELVVRHSTGELDRSTLVWVKDGLLGRLDDPKAAWTVATGSLVQAARADGQVTDADWVRFVDRHLLITPSARERNRADQEWTLKIEHRGPVFLSGDGRFAGVRIRIHNPTVRWGDGLLSDPKVRSCSGLTVDAIGRGSSSNRLAAPPAPGRGAAAFSFRVEVLDPLRTDSFEDDAVLGSFERSASIDLEFIADGTPILETDPDPAKADSIRQSIEVRSVSLRADRGPDPWLDLVLGVPVRSRVDPIPDLAFEIFLRPEGGGREWPIGSFALVADTGCSWNTGAACPGIVPGRHELVFRPSVEVAERSDPDLVRPWTGGEIVIPVGIERAKE